MCRIGTMVLALSGLLLAADPERVQVDSKVAAFSVQDLDGKAVASGDLSKGDDKALVVVFWSTTCPICANQYDRLVEIAKTYSDKGVRFVLVDPNPSESADDIKTYTDKQKLTFPYYRDVDKGVMKEFAASVTPACYLIARDGVLRYQGKMERGRGKKAVHYLTDAMDAVLAGKDVQTKSTMPSG